MIYIVDDDEQILNLTVDIVKSENIDVKFFHSPLDLLQNLKNENEVHLFLIDYQMPELTGFELIKEIRKIPGFFHTPVLIFSANTSEDNIIEGLNLGADDYINKPFRNKILLARIKRALQRNEEEKKSNKNYGFPSKSFFQENIEQALQLKRAFSISLLGIQNISKWEKNLSSENKISIHELLKKELKKLSFTFSRQLHIISIKHGVYALFYSPDISKDLKKEKVSLSLEFLENNLNHSRDDLEKTLITYNKDIEIKQGYFYYQNETNDLTMLPLCKPALLSLFFSSKFSGNTNDIWELISSMSKNKIHELVFERWKY